MTSLLPLRPGRALTHWRVPVSNFLNRGGTERVKKEKGGRQKPGKKGKPDNERASGVTTESRGEKVERDIRINIDELREHDPLQRGREEKKIEVEKRVI